MKKLYIWTFLLLLTLYIALVFIVPTDPQVLAKYSLSHRKAQMLNLSVVLPIALIYLSALYGFLRVNDYALSIRGTKEGPHFRKIAQGLMVLAFSLPITSVAGSVFAYIRQQHPQFVAEVTITRNYLALAFTVVAILLIAHGARGLYSTLARKAQRMTATGPSLYEYLVPITLASVYTWLITSQTAGTTSVDYLPNWLLATTLAVPYAFIWCVGIQAALMLSTYRQGVRGVIYRLALKHLAKGVVFIIITSMLIRLLTTLSGPLNRLHLTPLLGVIYLLIGIYAVGFGLVARGAKRLKQIEEA